MLVLGLEVGVVAGGNEGWHVEGLPHVGATATNEAFAFPLAGLTHNRCKTDEGYGLFVIEATELGHGGDELIGSQRSDARDAGEDLVPVGTRSICGDQAGMVMAALYALLPTAFSPLPVKCCSIRHASTRRSH